ncbi:MAG: hypothetical protein IKQ91_08955 [Oscillospiraceae bacterium]|nr:hypothetical protein [Oscillospiraceae bacterium]
MFDKLTKKAASIIAAAVLALSNVTSVYAEELSAAAEEQAAETAAAEQAEPDLTQQTIELYPDEDSDEKSVTLEGLMPEGAEATAVDVSDEHEGIAAYDITITDGEAEYQPEEGNPIYVEITDPVITENIELWHIHDDGEREQIFDFTAEDGKVSFYATGFSVYEIVEDPNIKQLNMGWQQIKTLEELETFDADSIGFYIVSTSGNFIKSNVVDANGGGVPNRKAIEATESYANNKNMALENGAVKYYIEKNGDKFRFYFKETDGETVIKKYLNFDSYKSATIVDNSSDASSATVTLKDANNYYFSVKGGQYLQYENNSLAGHAFLAGNGEHQFGFWYYIPIKKDPYDLDSKTYGLMYYATEQNGYAMMEDVSGSTALQSKKIAVRTNTVDPNGKLYVSANSDITMWTFHNVKEDLYKIEAENGKYLSLSSTGLTLTDDVEQASEIQVIPGTGDNANKIQLKCDGKVLKCNKNNGNYDTFRTGNATDAESWLNFVEKSELTEEDFVVYSAKKVGVSDKDENGKYVVTNGSKIIVYTRVWNESKKKYEFYAVDHKGRLVSCEESGDSIMWFGSQINTMLWEFTEYQYADGTPNGYYELYNPYSRKYLVPQKNGKILSPETVGINLEERIDDEYFSKIVAWDEPTYSFYALKADTAQKKLVSCHKLEATDESSDFYFAIMENLKPETLNADNDSLTPVETVDNKKYGIEMKMVDFNTTNIKVNNTSTDKKQHDVIGTTRYYIDKATTGLLTTDLPDSNNFPKTIITNNSLSELFGNGTIVNHLFIKSTYEATGYFEFDSCQNFATLIEPTYEYETEIDPDTGETIIKKDSNGNPVIKRQGANNRPVVSGTTVKNDFTVYKELGTRNEDNGETMQHGQFLPYNYITPGYFSDKKNLYTALAQRGKPTKGLLPEDDPRKNEKLYTVGGLADTNYYNGLELSAGFVQTPDGKDAWGHDIIFEFTGDDDFWLYVDNELVIDLGGIHGALHGKINFATGDVEINEFKTTLYEIFKKNYMGYTQDEAVMYINTFEGKSGANTLTYDDIQQDANLKAIYDNLMTHRERHTEEQAQAYLLEGQNSIFTQKNDGSYVFKNYTSHKMRIFYMERGAGASNLHMRFNLSYVTPGSVVMSKSVSGAGDIDYSLLKYPYQIEYKLTDNGDWLQLGAPHTENATGKEIGVYYLNPKKEATFYAQYKSPSNKKIYQNVYFLIPGKDVSISFPSDTIRYRIREVGLNSEVYKELSVNGEAVQAEEQDSGCFTIPEGTVGQRPNLNLVNNVDRGAVKTLTIEKRLVDKNENDITDEETAGGKDLTPFSFRLYLEQESATEMVQSVDEHGQPLFDEQNNPIMEPKKELKLAHIQKYYVLAPKAGTEQYVYCYWEEPANSKEKGKFIPSTKVYNVDEPLTGDDIVTYTFETSINGQISNIPAGYQVKVPNLLNGMKFEVEEREKDNPIGYDVFKLSGYECVKEGSVLSYQPLDSEHINIGTIKSEASPYLKIKNQRGYGIEVKKVWTDANDTLSHDPVFIAVYVDGVLKPDTVRQINDDITSQRYFFDDLDSGKTMNDYEVCEVTVTGNPAVDEEGHVTITDPDTVTKIDALGTTQVYAAPNDLSFGLKADIKEGAVSPVYIAVYKNGELQRDSVRLLNDTLKSQQYYYDKPDAGTTKENYTIKEVTIDNPPVADAEGKITVDESHTITPKDTTSQNSGITVKTTPGKPEQFLYHVEYYQGEIKGQYHNARSDTVTNVRDGGIKIKLYDWGSTDNPLGNGTFELTETVDGNEVPVGNGTYISSNNMDDGTKGNVAILYIDAGTYTLKQTSAPQGYISMAEPIQFTVEDGADGKVKITVNGNDNYDVNDNEYNNGDCWADENTTDPTQKYKGIINIHNKPFTLKAVKVDGSSLTPLAGAEFALYRGIINARGKLIKDYEPLEGYENLTTGANGEIPNIDATLPPDTYFLTEKKAPNGYEGLSASILFQIDIRGNITIGNAVNNIGNAVNNAFADQSTYLQTNDDKTDWTIRVPNTSGAHDYYINIEKIAFLDQYIHGETADAEQKFVFRVERFTNDDAETMASPVESFFVTLNCTNPYTGDLSKFEGNGYSVDNRTVTISYGSGKEYVFPASVFSGTATVKLSSTGFYRITEVSGLSSTDYSFWAGTNVFIGDEDGRSVKQKGSAVINNENDRLCNGCPYVAFKVTEADAVQSNAPTASFANCETEYAYLSSQAYAENTIRHSNP